MSKQPLISHAAHLAPDAASVRGKQPPIDASTDLLIVGAGPAGLSAALSAVGCGLQVTLVDENPVALASMGAEVPLHFGARMAPTLGNRNATMERMLAAHPQLIEAAEAGIDVRLGTMAWGLFPSQPSAAWIDTHIAGLADESSAYLMRFKQVIVASGRRDMALAFEGWQRPGVMGVSAAYRLAMTYEGLQSQAAVLLGADAASLQSAVALAEAGVRIVAIVEQSERITGAPQDLERLRATGTRVFTGHIIARAEGDALGVTRVQLVAVDPQGRWQSGLNTTLSCDTVLLGIAALPAIELLEACGCAVRFEAARGGHVPVVQADQRTSWPFMYAAGDCAGIWPSKCASIEIAAREGRMAANSALRALGIDTPACEAASAPDSAAGEVAVGRIEWVRASVASSPCDLEICQCEGTSVADILALRAPRDVAAPPATGSASVRSLDPDQPVSPDAIKRLTRAGMGPCQGRRCREQIAALIALESGAPLEAVPLATYRSPVRPLTLTLLSSLPECDVMAAHWDSWFGMPSQWVPFWRVAPLYEGGALGDEPAGCE